MTPAPAPASTPLTRSDIALQVYALNREDRYEFLDALTDAQFSKFLTASRRDFGAAYGIWQDDPVDFCSRILGVDLWSKQVAIVRSVEAEPRTVVPSAHGVGKTFTAAMLVAWFGSVHPADETRIVTTAPKMRQVKMLLWPHIHRVHAAARLPGELDQVQWKMPGVALPMAYGFSASDYDEDAVQGIHERHLLIVVDEAGGISHTLGRALESITTGAHTRILAIGNPPTDEEGSWFEERTESPLWHSIRIGWADTPNATGERVDPGTAEALVDAQWVADQMTEFGEDSTFVEARVHAQFPRGSTNKTIPYGWIETAIDNADPDPSTWVRLGIDVASDGGDEFVIAQAVGNVVSIVHNSSGSQNANPTDVAGKALEAIRAAETIRSSLGEPRPVRVKVDSIGLGWAVTGLLRAWGREGVHLAEIIDCDVSEKANNDDRFANKRAEMWWAGREYVRPRTSTDGGAGLPPVARLDIDKRCAAQLSAPKYGHDSRGRVQIEKKVDIKKRGVGSPDRAEAVLLALYEPVVAEPARTSAGLLLGQ